MAERHTAYHQLMEAFAKPGCPVCRIVEEALLRYLDMLIHENVNDIPFRDELRQAGGFCCDHAWWLVDRVRGAALGTAIMYRDVLHSLDQRLALAVTSGTLSTGRRRRGLTTLLGGRAGQSCPMCLVREREESAYLGTFADHCSEWRFLEGYESSAGLCFGHLEVALAGRRDHETARSLVTSHRKIVARMLHELDEFQRKTDYRFHDEAIGAEGDSWQRAVELVNGRPGVR
ncbi:MAG TPA: DUF6062 family protein [Chloroflexota bacterium]|jgi:hypothetical protein